MAYAIGCRVLSNNFPLLSPWGEVCLIAHSVCGVCSHLLLAGCCLLSGIHDVCMFVAHIVTVEKNVIGSAKR